jgi:hypothetical protein
LIERWLRYHRQLTARHFRHAPHLGQPVLGIYESVADAPFPSANIVRSMESLEEHIEIGQWITMAE